MLGSAHIDCPGWLRPALALVYVGDGSQQDSNIRRDPLEAGIHANVRRDIHGQTMFAWWSCNIGFEHIEGGSGLPRDVLPQESAGADDQ
jgi:hypothetical protein